MKKGETNYNLEEREWLIKNKDMPRKELVEAFNREFNRNQTLAALSTFMGKKLGITRKDYHLPYSEEQIQFLRDNFNVSRKTLTEMFNKRFNENRSVNALSKYISSNIGVLHPEVAFKYSEEQLDFLRGFEAFGACSYTYEQIAELFNKRFNEHKSRKQIRNVCCDRLGFSNRGKSPSILSEDELQWLKDNQKGISRKELVEVFNKKFNLSLSEEQIKNICRYRGWTNGYSGRFGDNSRGVRVPWAKGVHGEEFFAKYEEGYRDKLRNKTSEQFRKYRVGDIRIRHGYKVITTSVNVGDNDANYELYAKHVYEKAYGPGSAKKGRFVYLDGNPLNCELSNLRLVDDDIAMGLIGKNDLYGYGEITDTAIEMLKLKKAIKHV